MIHLTVLFQRVSKFTLDFSLILNNNFIEPLNLFHQDSSRHNTAIFKELELLVTNLEKHKKLVKSSRDGYYQMCSNAEKAEERLKQVLEKMDKGSISKKDFNKETERTTQLKIYAQEAKVEYEKRCAESTKCWADFRDQFFTYFNTFDLKEENRVEMIKRKSLALGNDLRNFYKAENPIMDLKSKYKEVDAKFNNKKLKSIVELIFGEHSVEKYKIIRQEEFIPYEKFKIEKEQRMFEEAFYVVDMEEATEDESDDLKMITTIIFNHFQLDSELKGVSRRREAPVMEEESTVDSTDRLFDDNQILNVKKAEVLFSKSCLRDTFIRECLKKIPEKRQPVVISNESFTNMSIVLKAIINGMTKINERDPAKFIDLIRILNTFSTKNGEEKKYLFQQFSNYHMFHDISLWSLGYKCLLKKKKMELEHRGRSHGTILNPWRVIQGIQSIIVKKNVEEDQQTVEACNVGINAEERYG